MQDLVEFEINRVPTKYRESTKFLALVRNYLRQISPLVTLAQELPTHFDLSNAVGEQLTFIGRQMGFSRPHPAGRLRMFFGFPGPSAFPVAGWSIGEWKNGPITEAASMEDEIYRRFLQSLVLKIEQRRSPADLQEAIRLLVGDTAYLLTSKAGVIRMATGRVLTEEERRRVHLFSEVLPIPPGMVLEIYEVEKAFGFGEGWGGWSEGHWPLRLW